MHGEINALYLLLWHLGYDKKGNHPDGRRIVFLGDLVDRGPDSPAVLELVMQLVNDGRAQCVLGNHEMNLLRDACKEGNDWFMNPDKRGEYPFKAVSSQQKVEFSEFLHTLPLALEREGLRVVHASWNSKSVEKLKQLSGGVNALEAYKKFDKQLECELGPFFVPNDMTAAKLEHILKDKDNTPPFMPELAKHESDYQMGNPVRVLTSGEEAPATKPFWANGKWRMVARQKWWESYDDEITVIMGHYWRSFDEVSPKHSDKGGPDLFEGIKPHHWMGKRNNVYCVDFSVGRRHRARAEGSPKYIFKLAAVRWPEQEVMYDNGTCDGIL